MWRRRILACIGVPLIQILFIYLNIMLKIKWIYSDYLFYYSVASTVDFEHIIVDWVCTSYNVPIFHSTKNQISHQGSFVQCSFQNFLFLRTLLKKSIALLKKCFNILDASILSVWHLALDLGSYFHLNILTEDLWSFHLKLRCKCCSKDFGNYISTSNPSTNT